MVASSFETAAFKSGLPDLNIFDADLGKPQIGAASSG